MLITRSWPQRDLLHQDGGGLLAHNPLCSLAGRQVCGRVQAVLLAVRSTFCVEPLESGLGPSLCISHWGTIAHSGGATDRMAGALQTMVELRRNRQGSYLLFVGLDSQSGAVAGPVSVDE